ncbi:MAG: GIY-YIG nuclease family protein [Azoarcus sp.]|nr:GIY-YIG nuclease family protein [Azoarcus sp.]
MRARGARRRWRSDDDFRNNDGKPGVVYILKNHAFPHLLKIGQSTRSARARAEELNNEATTGSPGRFVVVFERKTVDCGRAERHVFRVLSKQRFQHNREFFEVDEETAKTAVTAACEHFNSVAAAKTSAPPDPAIPPRIVLCPSCKQKLRVPSRRGLATCPRCRTSFDFDPATPHSHVSVRMPSSPLERPRPTATPYQPPNRPTGSNGQSVLGEVGRALLTLFGTIFGTSLVIAALAALFDL